ncbi:hypothetical protein DEJ33_01850 [Curtobacterium sp. MCPF17_047]|uniref:hypothetical protein n=1 Tax=unclassified Curtobacterium TaxID=257496 RepID=UPI000DA8C870|nr:MULTISPECIES: hypothetical protein [unclassified Curtobacterium]PZF69126.1 hypothetical protein DEJ33_01850 [Curtobacterium sp. MCPF17_047]WIB13732.1 hypothetical protein DEJ36_08655 [Curtobacterium sp. MCPF17_052]
MSVQLLTNTVIGLALVGYLAWKQATWRYLDPARIWRGPVVMAGIGIVVLAQSAATIDSQDVVFLGIEALLSVGIGLAMGSRTRFRTVGTPDGKGRTLQSRTGWVGAGLWIALIVVRIGLDVVGARLGAHLLTSTGVILLMLAVNRAARALVVDQRLQHDARTARGMMV